MVCTDFLHDLKSRHAISRGYLGELHASVLVEDPTNLAYQCMIKNISGIHPLTALHTFSTAPICECADDASTTGNEEDVTCKTWRIRRGISHRRVTAATHRMMASRESSYRAYLRCVGTYRSLHSVLTDEDNDVRGVENATALRATAAASGASDDSSRQKGPRDKSKTVRRLPFRGA
jgi:hypothetical protein